MFSKPLMTHTKAYRASVTSALVATAPKKVLDICCGDGWLPHVLGPDVELHGVDLFEEAPAGYHHFRVADFNHGLPPELDQYDAIVCCEAMGYLQNPGVFLQSVRQHLNDDGMFILSIPNPNYVGARVNHLIQGFPRSYSWFKQNEHLEPHMPWLSLGVFQLWLLLGLNGFKEMQVHEVEEEKPRHAWEYLLGWIAKGYAKRRFNKAKTESVRQVWGHAMRNQVIYGRQLVVSAQVKSTL
jgi:SAM-dependent methyltransferase